MHILGVVLITVILLTGVYFTGPKSNSNQVTQPSPPSGQVQALPVKPTASSNYDYEGAKAAGLSEEEILNYIATKSPNGTVTIRNKATGEIQKIPKSQLANYISSSKPKPEVVNASDKASKLSAYVFTSSNEKQKNDLISKFSNGTNDLKEAVKNLALLLDSKPEAIALIEKTIAQDIANKKSISDREAIGEYNQKEYERLKAEIDSLPKVTNNTYTGRTQNTNTYTGTTQNTNRYTNSISNSPNIPTVNTYKEPIRYDMVGDTAYGSDGSRYYQVGDTIYKNDGTKYYTVGDSLYGSNGSRYDQVGDSVYKNDGTRYDSVGDTVYGSDGSKYYQVGDSIYTQPGY